MLCAKATKLLGCSGVIVHRKQPTTWLSVVYALPEFRNVILLSSLLWRVLDFIVDHDIRNAGIPFPNANTDGWVDLPAGGASDVIASECLTRTWIPILRAIATKMVMPAIVA